MIKIEKAWELAYMHSLYLGSNQEEVFWSIIRAANDNNLEQKAFLFLEQKKVRRF